MRALALARPPDALPPDVLENGRPEDAGALMRSGAGDLPDRDPVQVETDLLRRRAAREVWAKHLPDWDPVWQAQVGPKGKVTIGNYPPPQGICVTQRTVVVLWPGDVLSEDKLQDDWHGVAALDTSTGRLRWVAAVGRPKAVLADERAEPSWPMTRGSWWHSMPRTDGCCTESASRTSWAAEVGSTSAPCSPWPPAP